MRAKKPNQHSRVHPWLHRYTCSACTPSTDHLHLRQTPHQAVPYKTIDDNYFQTFSFSLQLTVIIFIIPHPDNNVQLFSTQSSRRRRESKEWQRSKGLTTLVIRIVLAPVLITITIIMKLVVCIVAALLIFTMLMTSVCLPSPKWCSWSS